LYTAVSPGETIGSWVTDDDGALQLAGVVEPAKVIGDRRRAMAWRARIAWLRGALDEAESLARAALEAGAFRREWWRLIPAAVC
jgi:hypothetical protein